MAVEVFLCDRCDWSGTASPYFSASRRMSSGLCPKCNSGKLHGVSKAAEISHQRRRNKKIPREQLELQRKFERQLLELKEEEELHFMKRRRKHYEEDENAREFFKRKLEQAPAVFHTHLKRVKDSLHENENLFGDHLVERIDPLIVPSDLLQAEEFLPPIDGDVPFSELVAPENYFKL